MKTRSLVPFALLAALACSTPPKPPPPTEPQTAEPAPAPAQPPAAEAPAIDRSRPPEVGSTPPLDLPAQRHFTLANGLRVRLVEQRRLPIVALHLVVDAGAARDPEGLAGVASFTASMLTEGTRTRTGVEISDQVGFLGASLHADAGPDAASLDGAVLAEHLPTFVELFADVARNPAFRPADFERVQDLRRVGLLQQRDSPREVARRSFVPMFWGNHPYGHIPLGSEASLARTRRAHLIRFHERLWRPANAQLVVVGDVTEAELRPLLEKTLGSWPAGQVAPPLPRRAPASPHKTVLIDKPGASQSYLLLGMPGVERRSDDYVTVSVLREVLGGGMTSRLYQKLREEKGYTYGINAGADARRLAGANLVAGSVEAQFTGPALTDVMDVLERLRAEPIPPDELAEAKEGIARSLPAMFSTVSGIAGQVGSLAVHGLPDDYWDDFARRVREVSAADVQRVAQKYLDVRRVTLVVVGPKPVVQEQLAAAPIGKLEVDRVREAPLPRKPRPPRVPAVPGSGAMVH